MAKNTLLKPDENFEGLPPWMAAMRKVVADCVNEEDIKLIIQNQVKRAKEGDPHAIKFVFGQVLGGESFKGATFVQNNNYGQANPTKPLKVTGKEDRIETLRRRAEARLPLHNADDANEEPLRD